MFFRILMYIVKIYNFMIKNSFAHFGKGSIIKPILNTTNTKSIWIGDNVNIGSFSWVAVSIGYDRKNIIKNIVVSKEKKEERIRLRIGNNVDVGNNAFIVANNNIDIGDNVIMAPYVYISDHYHEYEDVNAALCDQPLSEGGYVKIEDNVFLGIKCCVLPNITIGRHSIVGAGAVVTKDVPPFSVVVGNPARVVKKYNEEKRQWEGLNLKK